MTEVTPDTIMRAAQASDDLQALLVMAKRGRELIIEDRERRAREERGSDSPKQPNCCRIGGGMHRTGDGPWVCNNCGTPGDDRNAMLQQLRDLGYGGEDVKLQSNGHDFTLSLSALERLQAADISGAWDLVQRAYSALVGVAGAESEDENLIDEAKRLTVTASKALRPNA